MEGKFPYPSIDEAIYLLLVLIYVTRPMGCRSSRPPDHSSLIRTGDQRKNSPLVQFVQCQGHPISDPISDSYIKKGLTSMAANPFNEKSLRDAGRWNRATDFYSNKDSNPLLPLRPLSTLPFAPFDNPRVLC